MNWSLAASPSIIFVAALIWLGAAVLSRLHWIRSGKKRSVLRLEILRLILITLLGLTLLRPEFVQTVQRHEQPEIAVLIDRSGSMQTRDIEGAAWSSRESWVSNRLSEKFWAGLERNAKVVIEEFGQVDSSTTNTAPVGTDLTSALESTLERERNLKSVLLLTDGDWNMGKSPSVAGLRYRERGIPVFSVAVGRETALPDIVLETVNAPSYGLFGEQITLPFSVRSTLPVEVKTIVILTESNRDEIKKEIVIPANGTLQDAILWYPRTVGDVELTLKVPVQPGEALPENNEQTVRISIRVDKLRVLVVDSEPRWESVAFSATLSRAIRASR